MTWKRKSGAPGLPHFFFSPVCFVFYLCSRNPFDDKVCWNGTPCGKLPCPPRSLHVRCRTGESTPAGSKTGMKEKKRKKTNKKKTLSSWSRNSFERFGVCCKYRCDRGCTFFRLFKWGDATRLPHGTSSECLKLEKHRKEQEKHFQQLPALIHLPWHNHLRST